MPGPSWGWVDDRLERIPAPAEGCATPFRKPRYDRPAHFSGHRRGEDHVEHRVGVLTDTFESGGLRALRGLELEDPLRDRGIRRARRRHRRGGRARRCGRADEAVAPRGERLGLTRSVAGGEPDTADEAAAEVALHATGLQGGCATPRRLLEPEALALRRRPGRRFRGDLVRGEGGRLHGRGVLERDRPICPDRAVHRGTAAESETQGRRDERGPEDAISHRNLSLPQEFHLESTRDCWKNAPSDGLQAKTCIPRKRAEYHKIALLSMQKGDNLANLSHELVVSNE